MTDTIVFPGKLEQAIQSNLVLPGSRLLLHGGNYTVGDLACALSGVTIMSYPGEQAIIIPASGYRAMLFDGVSDITLSNLIIDGSNVEQECIKVTGAASTVKIDNCEIRNATSQGILVTGSVYSLEISNCNIHHNGATHFDHGIYLSSDYAGQVASIHNNTISDNGSNGVHAYNGGTSSEYDVYSNYLEGNAEVGIGLYHGEARVYNNVVRGTDDRGITCRYGLVSALIAYNTVINSAGQNVELFGLTQETVGITVRNNLFLGDGGAITNNSDKAITTSNNLEPDWSLIADNGGADVRPLAGSEAIGGGVAIAGITTDYAGTARGNPPTIGAYES